MRPDPTFHASPKHAMEAPPENLAYQFIANPAYNADRGPVSILSGRLHAEF
jgi:hypothetical protein